MANSEKFTLITRVSITFYIERLKHEAAKMARSAEGL
jgi:hypothetical protein